MELLLAEMRPILGLVAITIASGGLLYFLYNLYHIRSQMKDLPGPPHHWLLGHIPIALTMSQALPSDVHPHHYWQYLRDTYSLGDFYYFDCWPLAPPTLIICSAELADHVTIKHCLDKHPLVRSYLRQHLGPENMAAANGAVWKKARICYNPGFATGHLMETVGNIVQDVLVFRDVLAERVVSGDVFELEAVAMKLSFDVIGRLVLGMSLDSQRSSNELVDAFRKQLHYLSSANTWSSPLAGLNPFRQWASSRNSKVIHDCLARELDQRFARLNKETDVSKTRDCILDMALMTANVTDTSPGEKNQPVMDEHFKQLAIDQIRTFIFAGHDTISTTISMIFLYLSRNPKCHSRACAELDDLFGPSAEQTAAKIKDDSHLLNRMPYCTAIIKETLRLFPPANTVRVGDGTSLTDPRSGGIYPLPKEWIIWPDSYVLGRDKRYFPSPSEFVPERYLADESSFPPIPAGAWRAFERGPRNCIGSEFGMLEIKVVMALTIREFAWVSGYDEETAERVDGEVCYQMLFGSAKPKGGVPGRMSRVKR